MSAVAAWEVPVIPAERIRPASRRAHLQVVPSPTSAVATAGVSRAARYRVRRLVVAAMAVAVIALLLTVVLGVTRAASTPQRVVIVTAGQTLSEIARAELPQLPTAEGVAQLQLANGLNSPQVRAGQRLVVPLR